MGPCPASLGPDDPGRTRLGHTPEGIRTFPSKACSFLPKKEGSGQQGARLHRAPGLCTRARGTTSRRGLRGCPWVGGGADPGGQRSRGSTLPPQPTCLLASKLSPEACRCPPGERVGPGCLVTSPGDTWPRGRSLTRPSGGSDGMQTHPFATQPPSWPSCSPVPAWFLSVCWSSRTVTAEQVTNGWCRVLSCQRSPGGNVRGSQNGFITNLWPQR